MNYNALILGYHLLAFLDVHSGGFVARYARDAILTRNALVLGYHWLAFSRVHYGCF